MFLINEKDWLAYFHISSCSPIFLLSQVAATSPRQWNICNIINLPWKETYYAQLPIFNFLLHLNNLNAQIRKCCYAVSQVVTSAWIWSVYNSSNSGRSKFSRMIFRPFYVTATIIFGGCPLKDYSPQSAIARL